MPDRPDWPRRPSLRRHLGGGHSLTSLVGRLHSPTPPPFDHDGIDGDVPSSPSAASPLSPLTPVSPLSGVHQQGSGHTHPERLRVQRSMSVSIHDAAPRKRAPSPAPRLWGTLSRALSKRSPVWRPEQATHSPVSSPSESPQSESPIRTFSSEQDPVRGQEHGQVVVPPRASSCRSSPVGRRPTGAVSPISPTSPISPIGIVARPVEQGQEWETDEVEDLADENQGEDQDLSPFEEDLPQPIPVNQKAVTDRHIGSESESELDMPLAPESALSELEPPPLSDLYALSGPSGSIVDSAADAVVTFATQRAVLAAPVALKLDLGPPQSPGGTGGTAASVDRLEQLEQLGRLAVPGQHDEYIADDQSDAPWASYRPTIGVSVGTTLPRDQFRHRIYEILDDPTYTQALYFLQCEYTKLPVAPFLPVRLDRLHTLKAQILLGVGDCPSVPALFWSSAQYFVRAAFALARAHSVPPEYIYANTAGLRRDMTFLGAFVGWLPLDYGIWRGKYDTEIDPRRTSYLAVTFPAVDDMWAFYFPSWSSRSLTKHTVTSITFGVAPVSRPLLRPSQARDRVAKQQSRAPSRLSRADKLRNRTSTCYTQ